MYQYLGSIPKGADGLLAMVLFSPLPWFEWSVVPSVFAWRSD